MYTENPMVADSYRKMIMDETNAFVENMRNSCDLARETYFSCDFSSVKAYEASVKKYRNDLINMLGYPLSCYDRLDFRPTENSEIIGEDEYGMIERLCIEIAPGLHSYGLLFTPKGNEKYPFVVALHGSGGTPEIISSFYKNSANYNHLVQRIRANLKSIVYVPQLIIWADEYVEEEKYKNDHFGLDTKLKHLGGSVCALEIFKIMKSVDYICQTKRVDTDHMGVAGLSYGGFYTILLAAIDTRFKSALSSCFFNERYRYPWSDMVWFDSASRFSDVELGALICPRSLCIQVGKMDEVFSYEGAVKAHSSLEAFYSKLDISDRLHFSVFDGKHEFNGENGDLETFIQNLMN